VTRGLVAIVVLLAPFLLGAADPTGDVAACPGVAAATATDAGRGAPDLVEATGEITELGTSVRFTLRFAEPLVAPDRAGKPFRVDVVLLDPDVPAVDAGLYRGVNRLLRYDAVAEPITTILLLPEAGQSRFIAPAVDGDTLTMQVPGRTLTHDEDETGTSPGLGQLRWGVIVRDEATCDLLGGGLATRRLVEEAESPPVPIGDADELRSDRMPVAVIALLAAVVVAGAYAFRRRARNAR
jgi:hypothetical protein